MNRDSRGSRGGSRSRSRSSIIRPRGGGKGRGRWHHASRHTCSGCQRLILDNESMHATLELYLRLAREWQHITTLRLLRLESLPTTSFELHSLDMPAAESSNEDGCQGTGSETAAGDGER